MKKILFLIMAANILVIFATNLCYSSNSIIASFDSMLQSDDIGLRFLAAKRLSAPNGIDSSTAAQFLVRALKDEVNSPISYSKIQHGMTNITESLKLEYTLSLSSLKTVSENIIYPMLDTIGGEFRDWLVLALALNGYKPVHEMIKVTCVSSINPHLRSYAIRALENYMNPDDIPLLKAALQDTFFVYEFINKDTGKFVNVYYPVRSEASSVLFKFGIDTKRTGWDFEIVEKRK